MSAVSSFFQNSGAWVSVSSVLSKAFAFATTLFLIRFLPKDDFGTLTIALNFIGFFIPALGFGSSHGLLRFGSRYSNGEKEAIISYTNWSGFILQIIISFIVIISAWILYHSQTAVLKILFLMVVRLFALFFLEQGKTVYRARFENKKYALLEITSGFFALLLGVVFTLLWGLWGYICSLCVYPLVVFLFYRFKLKPVVLTKAFLKEFWLFSGNSVLTILVFMWIFLIDVFFVAQFFGEEKVAFYKVSTLIPMNLIMISQIYTQTLYPQLSLNSGNRQYLEQFFRSYFRIFLPIIVVLVMAGFIFSDEIISLFGNQYSDTSVLRIMFLQMASCMIFRIPFGNLMGAMGHMQASLVIGLAMLVLNIILSLSLLPGGSPLTEACISLICVTLGGIASAIYFMKELKKLPYEGF